MKISREKLDLLENLSFGQRVAEDEPHLEDYFVETPLWRKMVRGEIDIVYGSKGSGKSAIFHLLTSGKGLPRNVIVIPAENPRGTPIFNGIKKDPPTSESEFIYLWKFYILSLIANQSQVLNGLEANHQELLRELKSVGVIDVDKSEILKNVLRYVESVKIGGVFEIGLNSFPEDREKRINIDRGLFILNEIVSGTDTSIWIAFDRLDSVFDDNANLEENALRALFKVYLDILRYRKIQLKIFLRTDIWRRLTDQGFREASHITRTDTIEWPENNIVNLISKRLLNNPKLVSYYNFDIEETLSDYAKQLELFYMVYPRQVDPGDRKPETVKWMMSRVADGTKRAAPRELIHLLNQAKDEQIESLEIGEPAPEKKNLFTSTSLKRALPTISRVRLEQTLFSEYPDVKKYVLALEKEKTAHTLKTLSSIWRLGEDEVPPVALKLAEVGFFEIRGDKSNPEYWIPFLYRPSLNLIQGKAEDDE
ncbi:hypothetical protein A2110_01005 [Candidatus Jorgensenbacteria bacterium GWA1_54_12]|uniref:Uncharacterized protein n=1 Tax=Candidatus Jorgensenbacteria bacterium GWA1_54_12 TaxID=1798468 RepID=A0A1F6BIP0_9BACT|nr:MAG: hypothetical protein A2110_01005 [Candidatus Jorgensenbacteria bacterium GWA1_54_12]